MANSVQRYSRKSRFKAKSSSVSYCAPFSFSAKPTRRLSPLYQGLFWGLTVSVTAMLSAGVGAAITLVSPFSVDIIPIIQKLQTPWQSLSDLNPTESKNIFQYTLSRPVNILIMGIDRVPDASQGSLDVFSGRSDTMLLLRFDPADHSVRMLSIPRDTRVNIAGVGYSKINDANVYGGSALAAKVVSQTLNDVVIDRYVRITTDAFIELVDLVGGVEVFVPEPMSYEDQTQKLKIDLEMGWQTLNGEQAEQFARFRSDRFGDIGRVQRQQILLQALQQKVYSPAIIPRIPQAMNILAQYIDTNLSVEELLALANFGKELQRENLKMVMLPGRFSQEKEFDERSYWILSQNSTHHIMQQYFGVTTETDPQPSSRRTLSRLRIAIQNATDDPGMNNQVKEYLARYNFHNVYFMADSPQILRESEIVVQKGDLDSANTLQSRLGIGRVEASSTGDLDSDITLRLGLDAKQLVISESFLKQASE